MSYFFTRDRGGLGAEAATVEVPQCVEVPDSTSGTGERSFCSTGGLASGNVLGMQAILHELGVRAGVPTGLWDNDTVLQLQQAAAQEGFVYTGGTPSQYVFVSLIDAYIKHTRGTGGALKLTAAPSTAPLKAPTVAAPKLQVVTTQAYVPRVITAPSPGPAPIPMLPLCPPGQSFNISTGQCVGPQEPVGPVVCPEGMMPGEDAYTCRPVGQVSAAQECAAAGGAWDWGTAQCAYPTPPSEEKPFPWLYVGLGLGGVAVLGGVFWYASSRKKATPNPRRRRIARRHRRNR